MLENFRCKAEVYYNNEVAKARFESRLETFDLRLLEVVVEKIKSKDKAPSKPAPFNREIQRRLRDQ